MTEQAAQRRAKWQTLAACGVAQNLAMGIAFGTFGPLLVANQAFFGIDRAMAATGMSLLSLALGVMAPLAGKWLSHVPVRHAMMGGALLSACGYAGLALVPSYALALCFYVLIGIGVCLTAILGPVTLVTRWEAERRGRMLALVNLPIILFCSPFLVALTLPLIGRTGIYLTMAAAFVVLLPLLTSIVERPSDQPAAAHVAGPPMDDGLSDAGPSFLRSPVFWLLSLGIGVLAGTGTVFMVHIVPFGVDRGMSLTGASMIQSIHAGAGIAGVLAFGWLADRIGPGWTLVGNAVMQALLWLALLLSGTGGMFVAAAMLGICSVPLVTLHGASLAALFGPARVSAAMGVSFGIKLPFLFCLAPLAGYLQGLSGSYTLPFLVCSAMVGLAALLFALATRLYPGLTPKRPRLASQRPARA